MGTHTIVVGIDEYKNPAWRLQGAVRDALAFAKWADDTGLAPGERTLLLNPRPAVVPPGWTVQGATRSEIKAALKRARDPNTAKADRLLFFCAGHACTLPTRKPEDGPVLVPADCDDLAEIGTEGVDFAVEFDRMRADGPPEQLFFVDGCRDVVEQSGAVTAVQQAIWNLAKVDDTLAVQGVLYATTSRKWANELGGRGIFTRALLEGLSGKGPELVFGDADDELLKFKELGEFVKQHVAAQLAGRLDVRAIKAQVPTYGVSPHDQEIVVRSFAKDLCRLRLRVRIEPAFARKHASVEVLQLNEQTGDFLVAKSHDGGDPVTNVTSRAGRRTLRVLARGFSSLKKVITLRGDDSWFVELTPESQLESAAFTAPSVLIVEARDPHVRITVRDAANTVVASQRGRVQKQLPAGPYVIESVLPGMPASEQSIDLGAGTKTVVLIRQQRVLAPSTMRPDERE